MLTLEPGTPRTRVVRFERGEREQLDVAEANTVVTGGRGMQGPEHWKLLEDLVEALGPGAALGASRAVVDAGWRNHGEQVGQTGKVVSPGLYFAIGISGAIQHIAGMRTANVIVAVNRDAEAPIFNIANYGLVGDIFEVLPRLAEEIRAARSASG
jgi:electron transfer flavoprotein alpha subunit